MKNYLSIFVTLLCAVLVVALVLIKRNDLTQHEADIGAIENFSNQLTSAQTKIAICDGTIFALSNNLADSQTMSSALSNQLADTKSTIVLGAEQIANLEKHIAELKSQNQILNQSVSNLTNQTVAL